MRPVKNNNTGTLEVSMFCPECRKRFGIFPYDKREMPDNRIINHQKQLNGIFKER